MELQNNFTDLTTLEAAIESMVLQKSFFFNFSATCSAFYGWSEFYYV